MRHFLLPTRFDTLKTYAEDSSDVELAQQALGRAGVVAKTVHCIDGSCLYTTSAPVPAANLAQLKADNSIEKVRAINIRPEAYNCAPHRLSLT